MANILLMSLVFAPDGVSTSVLMTELTLELQALGHNVTVITTTPHYNEDPEARKAQPLRPKWGKLLYTSDCHGIPVFHVSVSRRADRILSRGWDYLKFHIISIIVGLTIVKDYDVILAPSPPLTVGLIAWILGKLRRVPFFYNVQEIYPDIAVALGILRNRGLIWCMTKVEGFIYKHSRQVLVISEWFRRSLLKKGVPDEKIVVIPNFVDTDFIQPGARRNSFSKTHGLEDKFVILYAGNIGLTHDVESILQAARRLIHLPDLCFLIVGDGSRRGWLEEQVTQSEFPNLKLLPYQARSVIPDMYAGSDICLVTLKKNFAQYTFPSKIYTIMAAGRAAIVAAAKDSELSWVTQESGVGWTVAPDDAQGLANAIEYAYQQRAELSAKGLAGRYYVEQHHTRKIVARQYDQVIRQLGIPTTDA